MSRATLKIALWRLVPDRLRRPAIGLIKPGYVAGVVAAIVVPSTDGGDAGLVIVRHSYKPGWSLPGGLLERGEQPAEAVVREVAEEVGREVTVAAGPFTIVDLLAQRLHFLFVCKLVGEPFSPDDPLPGPEVVEARSTTPADVDALAVEHGWITKVEGTDMWQLNEPGITTLLIAHDLVRGIRPRIVPDHWVLPHL